jgi:hypothetical protein
LPAGDANIVAIAAILPCQWLLKTNKISNSMTKEATMLLLAVGASWVGPMQRFGCSFLPGDANIGGMTVIFPCQQFHKKETKWLLKPTRHRIL